MRPKYRDNILLYILIVLEIFFAGNYLYKSYIITTITKDVIKGKFSEYDKLISIMKFASDKVNSNIKSNIKQIPFYLKTKLTSPLRSLNYGISCANAANICIRLVDNIGYRARVLLILNDVNYPEHIVAEIFYNGRWILYDFFASNGYCYYLPNGEIASIQDIQKNPDLLDKRFKNKFNNYKSITRTNWHKYKWLPSIYNLLKKIIGKKIEEISVPTYKLYINRYLLILNSIFLGLTGLLYYRLRKCIY